MPCVAGLFFVLPLLVFVWMLEQIPAATAQDEAARSPRTPMTGVERLAMIRRHGVGLFGLMFAYLLITVLRSRNPGSRLPWCSPTARWYWWKITGAHFLAGLVCPRLDWVSRCLR